VHGIVVRRPVRVLRVEQNGPAAVRPDGEAGAAPHDHLLLPGALGQEALHVARLAQGPEALVEVDVVHLGLADGPALREDGLAAVALVQVGPVQEDGGESVRPQMLSVDCHCHRHSGSNSFARESALMQA